VTARSGDLLGAGLVVLAAACFGTLGPMSEFANDAGVSSLSLVTWRAGLGAALVGLFLAARLATGGGRYTPLRTLPVTERWFVVGASVANAVLNLAVFVAFVRIGIAMALLIFYLYPGFVALVSVVWFGERLDRTRWAALAIALCGMVLVVAGQGELGSLDVLGLSLALVGAVAQTFYVLAARHGFARVPAAEAAATTMAIAAVIYLAAAVLLGQAAALAQPLDGLEALWPVLVAGLIGAGIPTLAFLSGIRLLGAPRAAILAMFEPVVGVALAALLLSQEPTLVQLLGGLLIISAGIVLQRRPRADVVEHEAVPLD
jgi:drug/metabolite transporter (DMT)-like permease